MFNATTISTIIRTADIAATTAGRGDMVIGGGVGGVGGVIQRD